MDNNNVIDSTAVPVEQMNLNGVLRIPAVRQVILLVGIAASVAAGFALVLWAQTPGYTRLYNDLDTADAAQVAEALRAADIDYKLDTGNGVVLVPEARVHDARLEIASQGLPQGGGGGMDMLDEQSSFGVSQFMESARYQRALETELARTISHVGSVQDARVHLGLSQRSSFIRDDNEATASVMLTLYRGHQLEEDQAAAIVQLVAGSVDGLSASGVTVIDQDGRLLSSTGSVYGDSMAASQFRQVQKIEQAYKRRIEQMLTALVGPGRVRAEVTATLDFTVTEETRESFDPANTVIRAEEISEQQRLSGDPVAAGVPGATSNQPPLDAATAAATQTDVAATAEPVSTNRSSRRNFEVDRTISRTRPQSGTIQRLSVAVLVDDTPITNEAGDTTPSVTPNDITMFEALVRETVGFDAARGDTVVVTPAPFRIGAEQIEAEEPAIWEKPVVRDTAKQVLGVGLVLAIAFGIVRPLLRGLVSSSGPQAEFLGGGPSVVLSGGTQGQLAGGSGQLSIPLPSYDEKVAAAKNISGHDPARVAQVVRKWVEVDE